MQSDTGEIYVSFTAIDEAVIYSIISQKNLQLVKRLALIVCDFDFKYVYLYSGDRKTITFFKEDFLNIVADFSPATSFDLDYFSEHSGEIMTNGLDVLIKFLHNLYNNLSDKVQYQELTLDIHEQVIWNIIKSFDFEEYHYTSSKTLKTLKEEV